jgi:hypothetical protein
MDIPEELKGKEIDLSSIGLSEVALKYKDALVLIDHCERNEIFILGGDVLAWESGEYRHNYDNWYLNTDQGSFKDSVKKTKEYITNYPKGEYAFVFVTE